MKELKPCKICGKYEIKFLVFTIGNLFVQGKKCLHCGYRTALYPETKKGHRQSRKEWNTRAGEKE